MSRPLPYCSPAQRASAPSVHIVRSLLEKHAPADQGEADSLRRIAELVARTPEPFSRRQYAPGHLTASAIVVAPQREATLLVFHSRLQRWLQPGGHFESGEVDPALAAAREVIEETGAPTRWPGLVPVLLDVDVHTIPARPGEPAHCHFDLRLLLLAELSEARAGEGVTAARWLRSADLMTMDLDPGLQRALWKAGMLEGGG